MHSFVQVHFVISVFRELKAPKENAEVVIAISNILIKSSSAKGFDHSNALRRPRICQYSLSNTRDKGTWKSRSAVN